MVLRASFVTPGALMGLWVLDTPMCVCAHARGRMDPLGACVRACVRACASAFAVFVPQELDKNKQLEDQIRNVNDSLHLSVSVFQYNA